MHEQLLTARQPSVVRTNLQKNTLAQAAARVNRPYPDKESGLIVDYPQVRAFVQAGLQKLPSRSRSRPVGA
jgi:type I site-specific restriction-modification system R (restriction) subunit